MTPGSSPQLPGHHSIDRFVEEWISRESANPPEWLLDYAYDLSIDNPEIAFHAIPRPNITKQRAKDHPCAALSYLTTCRWNATMGTSKTSS